MNEIQIFNYNDKQVRIIEKDGEPWWVLKDVCVVLEISDVRRVAERLDIDEWSQTPVTDSLGRKQNTYIINESGLYNVILRSDKPEAKPFRKWVTSEVLPAIRKHGGYLTPTKIEEIINNPDLIIQLATNLKEEREKNKALILTNKKQEKMLEEAKSKVAYYDIILQNKDAIPIGTIAKDYGVEADKFNLMLASFGIQYKRCGQWVLTSTYSGYGYTVSKTKNINNQISKIWTYWTQKGRLFLYNFLKKKNVLPVIERDDIYIKSTNNILSDFPVDWIENYNKYKNKIITAKQAFTNMNISSSRFYRLIKKYEANDCNVN